jgi:hypothetical protein
VTEDAVDQKADRENAAPVNEIAPKPVKMGAAIGMTAGWMIGLIYVVFAFPSMSFGQQGDVDGILMSAPVLGAALGAGIGSRVWRCRLGRPAGRSNGAGKPARSSGSGSRKATSQPIRHSASIREASRWCSRCSSRFSRQSAAVSAGSSSAKPTMSFLLRRRNSAGRLTAAT